VQHKIFHQLFSQMLKLGILAILSVPCIPATFIQEIAKALIAERDTGKLEQTFQALHKEHGNRHSSWALAEVAKQDPFPNDRMCVSYLMHSTIFGISSSTSDDPESFAKAIASFKPTDAKPLASIRLGPYGEMMLWLF
jgi:hypothetical protein